VTLAEAGIAVPDEAPTPDTVWGAGSVTRLADVCAQVGAGRVMAVAGRSANGVADRLPTLLGRRYLGRWSDVPAHVPAHQASLAVGSAQETHADAVAAIGGGSAIGLAKIVALALRLPLIAVPTTFAGTEMNSRYLVTTATGVETGTSARVLPAAVIYDPSLAALGPGGAVTGATAVAHCLEALTCPGLSGDARAREALLLLWESLPRVAAGTDDFAARQAALAGASLAGQAHQAAGPGPLHRLCELGAARGAGSYAVLQALLLPLALRAHGPAADPARAALGALRPDAPAEAALADFAVEIGITATLDQPGLRTQLAALADQAAIEPSGTGKPVATATWARLRELIANPEDS
jgi:maleylacetate reductase